MKNKGNIILSVIGVVLSIALLVVSTILAEEKIINTATAVVPATITNNEFIIIDNTDITKLSAVEGIATFSISNIILKL